MECQCPGKHWEIYIYIKKKKKKKKKKKNTIFLSFYPVFSLYYCFLTLSRYVWQKMRKRWTHLMWYECSKHILLRIHCLGVKWAVQHIIDQGCQTQILSRANYALGFRLEGHNFLELRRFNTTQCGNFLKYKLANTRNRLPARYLIRWTSKCLRHRNPRKTVTRVEKSLVISWATQDHPAGHEFDAPVIDN